MKTLEVRRHSFRKHGAGSQLSQAGVIASDDEFIKLVQAIVMGETEHALRLIAESPQLAQAKAQVGASRQVSKPYFFEAIGHYLYEGDTALHIAAAGFRWEIAEALIACGAPCDAKNRMGAQPLHYAADANTWNPIAQSQTIAGLIRAGADANAVDKQGTTPLHRAVRTRCAAAVEALLQGGANPQQKNKRGSTPLQQAMQKSGRGGSGTAHALEQQRQIIERLLNNGDKPE